MLHKMPLEIMFNASSMERTTVLKQDQPLRGQPCLQKGEVQPVTSQEVTFLLQ